MFKINCEKGCQTPGIHSFGGVTGNADEAVKKYLSGKLEFTTDVTCTKHESGENHSCGGHCH